MGDVLGGRNYEPAVMNSPITYISKAWTMMRKG